MVQREIVLLNDTGLHARPASMIVKEAAKYISEIKIIKNEKEYNAKSIMSILSMGAIKGDCLVIRAIGEDEEKAVEELGDFIENKIMD
ncbi:HPr family phosphocarrier protein [Tissierella carlieri]|jgi:phosphocarrier protein HPr|uniref:HPr family phosphocarrier protein n=1 Tax=Tissierella TaxID=41273 RepID=UPI000BA107FA|nr:MULTISPECIES: HPr family phosphocarrier protein [Tissierella]MBU5312090.1 HPr family phosphocarrier protein [Tissierella carlieri]MDU5080973.1 HPr family phosphocarrier protein [Bacillota bacterium]OZV11942.1 phosphocarrier protein HPr [Tissierella sp. P1]